MILNLRENIPQAIFLAIVLVATSCTSLDHTSFEKYANAVELATKESAKALDNTRKLARQNLIERIAQDPNAKLSKFLIEIDKGYRWKIENPPLYMTLEDTRTHLEKLSETFVEYARLLQELAGGAVSNPDEFIEIAKTLNQNGTKITQTLDAKNIQDGIPIISTLAAALFKEYVDSHRKEKLREAIVQNQETVVRYSNLSISLIQLLRTLTKSAYTETFGLNSRDWKQVSTNRTEDKANRRIIASRLVDLNDGFIVSLDVLEAIEKVYRTLPVIHAELAAFEKKETNSFRSKLIDLQRTGQRLNDMYSKLKQ